MAVYTGYITEYHTLEDGVLKLGRRHTIRGASIIAVRNKFIEKYPHGNRTTEWVDLPRFYKSEEEGGLEPSFLSGRVIGRRHAQRWQHNKDTDGWELIEIPGAYVYAACDVIRVK